ncbi:hypothetical protein LFL96_23245 [Paraburkholderia sp. D15]|uniref:CIS tube protein n=1 Tax=Paraburkholderia sp. D15 TaxID=2880218 RepID=UPI0024791C64|nr:hypothetical protein [Paraburkholderia sp. D15]WGS53957.1 hypothetical protein LFL96_23245 [Paraburkholderia sp. D15]
MLTRSLSRLTISAYVDREMTQLVGSIVAMYNPESLSMNYQTDYTPDEFINTTLQSNRYYQTRPTGLSIDLLFDAEMPGNRKPVEMQLTQLRSLCYAVDAARSEPHFLRVKWGRMRWSSRGYFSGRMNSLSVRYTQFDRDATPTRATASISLTADESLLLQAAEQQLKAPAEAAIRAADLTPLPQIAAKAGASIEGGLDYLTLASTNDLNSLDAIEPGQLLRVVRRDGAA